MHGEPISAEHYLAVSALRRGLDSATRQFPGFCNIHKAQKPHSNASKPTTAERMYHHPQDCTHSRLSRTPSILRFGSLLCLSNPPFSLKIRSHCPPFPPSSPSPPASPLKAGARGGRAAGSIPTGSEAPGAYRGHLEPQAAGRPRTRRRATRYVPTRRLSLSNGLELS